MPDELPVHVSREELHAIDVQPIIKVQGSFDVRLINHGESLHVHVHLDDALSDVASIDAGNHHVAGRSQRNVRVEVNLGAVGEETTLGKIKLVSAYGAQTRWVDVEVLPPDNTDPPVEVDEELAKPKPREPEQPKAFDQPEVLVLALTAVVLLVAVLTALLVQNTLLLIGSLLVLTGVLAALYFLLGGE